MSQQRYGGPSEAGRNWDKATAAGAGAAAAGGVTYGVARSMQAGVSDARVKRGEALRGLAERDLKSANRQLGEARARQDRFKGLADFQQEVKRDPRNRKQVPKVPTKRDVGGVMAPLNRSAARRGVLAREAADTVAGLDRHVQSEKKIMAGQIARRGKVARAGLGVAAAGGLAALGANAMSDRARAKAARRKPAEAKAPADIEVRGGERMARLGSLRPARAPEGSRYDHSKVGLNRVGSEAEMRQSKRLQEYDRGLREAREAEDSEPFKLKAVR